MSWVAVAVAAGSAVVGGVQANQERQRKKGVIGKAYDVAGQRLKLRQGDVRQGTAESLVARGLSTGSDVSGAAIPRPAQPKGTVPGLRSAPHTLGEQQMADLGVEQSLEAKDLAERKGADYSAVNAEANSSMIAAAVNGIGAGVGLRGALQGGDARSPVGAGGNGVMVDTPPPGGAVKYPGSFAGVDPVDPLGRGAWKSPATTGGFNVFNEPGAS